MIERPFTHPQDIADETGERYLANLGLTWDELRGKRVLDIGALSAEFENAARRNGIDVVSVDMGVWDIHPPPIDSNFVIAKATKLPFKDISFDHVVAHQSAMNYLESGYGDADTIRYYEDVLRETSRVLKQGGQFHFTDTALDAIELQRDPNDIPPEPDLEYQEWRAEREHALLENIAKRAGFRELKLIKYDSKGSRPEGDEHLHHFYIAIK